MFEKIIRNRTIIYKQIQGKWFACHGRILYPVSIKALFLTLNKYNTKEINNCLYVINKKIDMK